MGSILNQKSLDRLIQRIDKITPDDKARWGKMNASEAVCHMRDQLRVALGERKCARKPTGFLTTWLGKRMAIDAFKWPKGKIPTVYEMDQKRGGTPTAVFEKDKEALIESIHQMQISESDFHDHPAFGHLNRKEWGRLAWKHLDHHLKQFGR